MESESGDYENAYRIVTPAGQVKHVLSRGKVLRGATGKPERIIGLVIDVTAQHATEEALLRTEKLAAAGRMAATVAHEINNPLQAVLSTLFLVRCDPTISTTGAQLAQTAEEEIRRVASLAQRSLSFFRETRAKTNLSLSRLVSEVAEVYRSQAERTNIRYEVQVEPDCVAKFNAAELKQVLSNLIINALDAMPNGGTLVIQAHTRGEWLELQVEDSGSGIEARLLDKIFDPFFTTKESIGTGLGLWVSKNIIEANGGTLRVETQTASDRHGSRFIVRLPLTFQKASTAN
jgi:signal transduction histidine kinase